MIERVHEHLIEELQNNARTDTVFVIVAIALNLITLAVNSTIASSLRNANGSSNSTSLIVMFTFVALIIVINFVSEIGLIRGRQMRAKLQDGLLKMYKDQGVDGYYNPSLQNEYRTRYNLFMIAVLFTGVVALVIPFVIR